jgi:uncharacterized protein (DUF1697 family)
MTLPGNDRPGWQGGVMSGTAHPNRYVALLRGINVGTAKQLAMADLKAVLEGLGHTEVRTYLRSGQVVFTDQAPGRGRPAALAAAIEDAIAKDLRMDVPVVVRSRPELAKVVKATPFVRPGGPGRDPARLFCVFLSDRLTAADLKGLDPATYDPEEFALGAGGREIFLWLPAGMGVSKLGGVKWDRVSGHQGLVATARNWRTTLKLLDLLDA